MRIASRLAGAVLGSLVAATWALAAPRAVGVATLRFDKTSVTTGAPRPMPTVVWYPATPGSGTAERFGLRDARVRPGRYPLILFSHGNCGRPTEASYLTMALAAEGFVVAAVPHPGNTADDGSACLAAFGDSLSNRLPDVRFVLDQMLAQAGDPASPFHRRIRTDAVGMSGLSFGGFTTILAAQAEPRLRAAFPLVPGGASLFDPGSITIPTLVIGSERDTIVSFAESRAAYELVAGPRFLVELRGGNHLSSVDSCVNPDLGADLCVPQDISQEDAHRLILRYAVPFFRRYLKHDRAVARRLTRPADGVVLEAEPRRPRS